MRSMPRIGNQYEDDDELFSDEELLEDAELARIERRDHDTSAQHRALMENGAAKQWKAMTEAPSFKGVPKVAKERLAARKPAPKPAPTRVKKRRGT
jgi:hypothetical protein